MKIPSFVIKIAKFVGMLFILFLAFKIKQAIHTDNYFFSTSENSQRNLEKPIPMPIQSGDKIYVTLFKVFKQKEDFCIFYFETKNKSSLDIRTGHFLIQQIGQNEEIINLGYMDSDIGTNNAIKEGMMYAKNCAKTKYLQINSLSFYENSLLSNMRNDMPIIVNSNIAIELRAKE